MTHDAAVLREPATGGIAPPMPAPAPPGPDTPPARRAPQPFRFTGQAGEYFRIWIVNLALTVLTLGVWSAWAKVRTQRYFYGNTLVDEAPFEYLADPIPILKGRLIAAAALAAYLLTANLAPLWEPALLLALFAATPWIIVRGNAFRAHNSAWKGLRFRFVGRTRRAYVEFLLLYVPVILSLGLALPWLQWRQRRYLVESHRFGGARAFMTARVGELYLVWALAMVGMIATGVVAFVVVMVGAMLVAALGGAGLERDDLNPLWIGIPIMVVTYLGYFATFVFAQTRISNLVWNATALGGHGFQSTLRVRDMLWLYLSNTVAILATAGLAIPWARVRMAHYRAAHLELLPGSELDAFVAEAGAEQAATGQELGDFFDVDLGF